MKKPLLDAARETCRDRLDSRGATPTSSTAFLAQFLRQSRVAAKMGGSKPHQHQVWPCDKVRHDDRNAKRASKQGNTSGSAVEETSPRRGYCRSALAVSLSAGLFTERTTHVRSTLFLGGARQSKLDGTIFCNRNTGALVAKSPEETHISS